MPSITAPEISMPPTNAVVNLSVLLISSIAWLSPRRSKIPLDPEKSNMGASAPSRIPSALMPRLISSIPCSTSAFANESIRASETLALAVNQLRACVPVATTSVLYAIAKSRSPNTRDASPADSSADKSWPPTISIFAEIES